MAEKIPLYVFSGTGNTLMAAREFARQAAVIDKETEICTLDRDGGIGDRGPARPETDLFGLFYPVYGFGTPRIVLDWAERLSPGEGRRCFLILTAAGGEAAINVGAPNLLIRRLKRKGYEVPYVRILRMGSNWVQRFPDDFTRQLMGALPDKCANAARAVAAGEGRTLPRKPVLSALLAVVAHHEDHVGARVWGRLLKAGDDCDGCGLCVKRCPMGNISGNGSGRVSFGWNCQWCMRCVYSCPKNAIVPRFLKSAMVPGGYNPKAISTAPDTGERTERLNNLRKKAIEYLENPAV